MILGTVNAHCELVVPLRLLDSSGQEHSINFVVDTGFNGTLTLPAVMVAQFGLVWNSAVRTTLGDGSTVWLDRYEATVLWDGSPQHTLVQAVAHSALLGIGLLAGHDLRARIEDGGTVEIEAIP